MSDGLPKGQTDRLTETILADYEQCLCRNGQKMFQSWPTRLLQSHVNILLAHPKRRRQERTLIQLNMQSGLM